MRRRPCSVAFVLVGLVSGGCAGDPASETDDAASTSGSSGGSGQTTTTGDGASTGSTGSVDPTTGAGPTTEPPATVTGETSTTGDPTGDPTGDDTGVDPTVPTDSADNLPGYAKADDWNFPSDNYFVCGTLKNSPAPLRHADFGLISEGHYTVHNGLSSDECGAGKVRFDLHEILETTHGRLLFHKGGQGYADTKTPYGHLWIADLESPSPKPQVSGEPPEYGAPSKIPGTDQWDWVKRNGVGCDGTEAHYYVKIVPQGAPDALPADWQYKPNQTSSRFNKYADAGAEQAEGTAHHAYLLWSWLHQGDGVTTSKGGGQVRVLLRDGQEFHRCAIDSIDSVAYAADSDVEVGRVTAIYGKTRGSADGPWVYGWTIHSHRAKHPDASWGPRVYHFKNCPGGVC
jgi:hypothetical protein